MLINTDWLKTGELFPPRCEIPRIKTYKDNYALFNGDSNEVLAPYNERFKKLIEEFESDNIKDYFLEIPNYWQYITIKTLDLMVSDRPNISIDSNNDKNLIDENKDLIDLLEELIIDFDICGEAIAQCFVDKDDKKKAVVKDLMMWFPVVDTNNIKSIKNNILAWVVRTYQDANNPQRDKYELHAQIFTQGSSMYIFKRFELPNFTTEEVFNKSTNENLGSHTFYKIGNVLENVTRDCGIIDPIIHFRGIRTSKSIHGTSNYDRITGTIAEMAIRKSLRDYILDKNSTPRLAAPESAFVPNKEGIFTLKTGGRNFIVGQGQPNPQYITWDGSIENNERAIDELTHELGVLSEMGSLINNTDLSSSQGYEALRIKLVPATAKVQRMCNKFDAPFKLLTSKIMGIDEDKISIVWNYGLPPSESENLSRASQAKSLGVSQKTIFKDYFHYSDKRADEEIEQAQTENADSAVGGFGVNRGFNSS
jgi:hypothetical protein